MTVVVVNYNGAHLLPACLDSLLEQTVPHRLVVVDNASTDESIDVLARYPEAEVLRSEVNTGFAGGAQLGMEAAEMEIVALLNNDATAAPDWLAELLAALDHDPTVAAVTSKIRLSVNGHINNAGGVLSRWGEGGDRGLDEPDDGRYDEPVEVFAFCGGAAALRRTAALEVGGFPTEFFLYYEDTDLSWRLRLRGYRIVYQPRAIVDHLHSATSDPASDLFAFHNLRNHLLTLLRNAPMRIVTLALLRFLAVTGRDLLRHGSVPALHRPQLRLRALASLARMSPEALRHRAGDHAHRAALARHWLGVPARPLSLVDVRERPDESAPGSAASTS